MHSVFKRRTLKGQLANCSHMANLQLSAIEMQNIIKYLNHRLRFPRSTALKPPSGEDWIDEVKSTRERATTLCHPQGRNGMSLTGRPSFICFGSRPQVGVEPDELIAKATAAKVPLGTANDARPA